MTTKNVLQNVLTKILFMIFMLAAVSCIPATPTSKKSNTASTPSGASTNKTNPDTTAPGSTLNYLQNGSTMSSGLLILPTTFDDALYLRGDQIHIAIAGSYSGKVMCLYSPQLESDSGTSKALVMALIPKSFMNYTTNKIEYYYQFSPKNDSINKAQCLSAGIQNYATASTQTLVFKYNDLCSTGNCTANKYTTASSTILTQTGIVASSLSVNYLNLRFTGLTTESSQLFCSASSTCSTLGYSCCINAQCVTEGDVKSTVTNLSDPGFLQALQDVTTTPSNKKKYPQYYYVCPTGTDSDLNNNTTTPNTSATNLSIAEKRLITLKELYNCTTLRKYKTYSYEESRCTVTFDSVTLSGQGQVNFDDTTFNGFGSAGTGYGTSITNVHYNSVDLTSSNYTTTGENSTLLSGDGATVQLALTQLPTTDQTDLGLKIEYRVDGSCTSLNSTLYKCTKYYIQGATGSDYDEHQPLIHDANSQDFELPMYATGTILDVRVDGTSYGQNVYWSLIGGSPYVIHWNQTASNASLNQFKIGTGQYIAIDYTVNKTLHPYIGQSRNLAQTQINNVICNCSYGKNCSLIPEYDVNNNVSDYKCVYPDNTTYTPPLEQTVYVSSRNLPHRLFSASTGAPLLTSALSTSVTQEGKEFKYESNGLPNNILLSGTGSGSFNYIGMNEIFGTVTTSTNTVLPPLELTVKAGKVYNIFSQQGMYTPCQNCGNDYYGTSKNNYPIISTSSAAGVIPEATSTKISDGINRADDFQFGRACFVPATMIPWSHGIGSLNSSLNNVGTGIQGQRLAREASQHFLYANGYQRDWYGFNYGSLIGSFDGVTWFSIGNQRKIIAKGNKLFLAVNTAFGDLNSKNSFTVKVSENIINDSNTNSGSRVEYDVQSDGASCQAYHSCKNDQECVTKLGWDYACADPLKVQTTWPRFDINGNELFDLTQPAIKSLAQIISPFTLVQGKKCMYRGAGAQCKTDGVSSGGYLKTAETAQSMCAPNYFCQTIDNSNNFTVAISRLQSGGSTLNTKLNNTLVSTFGMDAPVIGRPMRLQNISGMGPLSLSTINSDLYDQVLKNIKGLTTDAAICLPGKEIQTNPKTFESINDAGTVNVNYDRIRSIGVTSSVLNATSNQYLSLCPTLDDNGDLLHNQSLSTTNDKVLNYSASQNIPSNIVSMLTTNMTLPNSINTNFIVAQNSVMTTPKLQENACLRAPGAACHTDWDCAANESFKKIGTVLSGTVNPFEVKFWNETLTCSQETAKSDTTYSLAQNRCCRMTAKSITIPTNNNSNGFTGLSEVPQKVAGADANINSDQYLSRFAPLRKEWGISGAGSSDDKLPRLNMSTTLSDYQYQWSSFSKVAERTCCSGNWVRNFANSNGSGDAATWTSNKRQNYDKSQMQCYNFAPSTNGIGSGFFQSSLTWKCASNVTNDDIECPVRNIGDDEANAIMNWLGLFELAGVPQVPIGLDQSGSFIRCPFDPSNTSGTGSGTSVPTKYKLTTTAEQIDDVSGLAITKEIYNGNSVGSYISSVDVNTSKFANSSFKKIFSEDSVRCCTPAGSFIGSSDNSDMCCTGYAIATTNASYKRCVLPNFTDLSVYFNRYISSAAKDIDKEFVDPVTGFLSTDKAIEFAFLKNICEEGAFMNGVGHTKLPAPGIPIAAGTTITYYNPLITSRFVDRPKEYGKVDLLWDKGVRWNTHIYCVPKVTAKTFADYIKNGYEIGALTGIKIYNYE